MERGTITEYLTKLGIDAGAIDLYIALIQAGYATALQLAQRTRVSRTQVYRHLEALQACGLVSAEQLSYGTLYRPQPLENIERLIADREAEVAGLRHDLGGAVAALHALA